MRSVVLSFIYSGICGSEYVVLVSKKRDNFVLSAVIKNVLFILYVSISLLKLCFIFWFSRFLLFISTINLNKMNKSVNHFCSFHIMHSISWGVFGFSDKLRTYF